VGSRFWATSSSAKPGGRLEAKKENGQRRHKRQKRDAFAKATAATGNDDLKECTIEFNIALLLRACNFVKKRRRDLLNI